MLVNAVYELKSYLKHVNENLDELKSYIYKFTQKPYPNQNQKYYTEL